MRKLRLTLFLLGRLLSVLLALYYVVTLVLVLVSGVKFQLVHNSGWVGTPFISGTIAIVVGLVVSLVVGLRKGRVEYESKAGKSMEDGDGARE